jgi:hypothetical protein
MLVDNIGYDDNIADGYKFLHTQTLGRDPQIYIVSDMYQRNHSSFTTLIYWKFWKINLFLVKFSLKL